IMPQMGESVAEGTVVKWLKKVGERVERDEPLFEISTDKVDAEIPSPTAGVLTKILVKENETVEVNTVVAEIDGESAGAVPPKEKPKSAAPKPAPAGPIATAPAPAPAALPASTKPRPQAAPRESITAPADQHAGGTIRSSPLVRRIASEHHVDLARVPGTGLGGRVSKKDILGYLAQSPEATGGAPSLGATSGGKSAAAQKTAAPPIVFSGPTEVVAMTPMRRLIAEHMVASKNTSAHVATVFEVELTRVFELRAQHGAEFEKRNGLKLTYTPFFVRATVEAIRESPILNSSVEGTNVVYKRDVNIGVAVALETGLIVPVIKRADEKNFLGIARAVQDLAERARAKKLSVEDVQGGTFTITNPGIFGSLFGTPIINQPQVAILGVGAIEKRPVVRHDAIAVRPMVYLTLSFDHRIIDGAVADQFMRRVKTYLENWDEPII
ncbi:MAG TPA: dihydrolipoyllysine-residue succinyltransferase, partial [Terriglobia bacterium]|nr:dihydrolipoyllysine-residue succinyltransferase [Terriglobia bacterium]